MIDAGILRLWSMQTAGGGIAYWPGGSKPELFPSTYVGWFLLQAQRAGHAVDPRFTHELLEYLQASLYGRNGEKPDDNMRAMIVHVLAGFGRPEQGWISRLSEQADQLDIAGRAHLAAAWIEVGRKDKALAVLPADTIEKTIVTTTGDHLTSQVQQEATLLSVMTDLDPRHAWTGLLAQRLDKSRKAGGCWGSTIDSAMALAALSRCEALQSAAAERGPACSGSLRANGGTLGTFDPSRALLKRLEGPATFEVVTERTGNAYVTLAWEGVPKDRTVKEYDQNLQVRRRWLDRAGKTVDPAKVRVGDLIFVEVNLSATVDKEDAPVRNIAVVDALPGGTEVENTRLATSDRSESQTQPNRVEFQDDRVILFASAGRAPRTFRYSLRVISPGTFEIPPIQASCMYDPAYASVSDGSGRLEVRP
jgi:uncharacterized protein YfaS (alpha-2-macroglobulin family)